VAKADEEHLPNSTCNALLAATVPLFFEDFHDRDLLIQDRSGVLVRLDDYYFVFTATHEMRERVEADCKLFTSVSGRVVHKRSDRDNETLRLAVRKYMLLDEGVLDVAIIEISRKSALRLMPAVSFLSTHDLLVAKEDLAADVLICGYPFNCGDPGHPCDPVPAATAEPLLTRMQGLILHRHSREESTIIESVLPKTLKCPDGHDIDITDEHCIKGMSGCGIWLVDTGDDLGGGRPKLVAIFHGSRLIGGLRHVFGTSIDSVLSRLVEEYPSVHLKVPTQ
jgi:hypothetical protein